MGRKRLYPKCPIKKVSLPTAYNRGCRCEKCSAYKNREYLKNKPKRMRQQIAWRKRNPIKELARKLRVYGLSVKEYYRILKKQKRRCAICGIHESKLYRKMDVDHNHKTNMVRGLLCNECNGGLGKFKDDPKLIKKALSYLKKNDKCYI